MPIKLSGPINYQDIVNEFGGTNPIDLSDYYRGGGIVPNKNANSKVPISGAISLGDFYGATKIIELTYKLYGGGGAGGSGFENNSTTTSRAGDGGRSGILTKAAFDALSPSPPDNIAASTFNISEAAEGGQGGQNGVFTDANATAGEASDFGEGGAAGPRNAAGASPTWTHWGAAGGGGGGDQGRGDDYFLIFNRGGADEWGKAGAGGNAADPVAGTVDVDVEVDYVVSLGRGGLPATDVGNHDGGFGNPGYVEFTLDTTGNTKYVFTPPASPIQRSIPYYFGFRILRNGTVQTFDV